MPGSLRLDDDPFASLLGGDPFEAALQSTDRDCRWVLGSPSQPPRRGQIRLGRRRRPRCSTALHACENRGREGKNPLGLHPRGIKISTLRRWLTPLRSRSAQDDPPKEVPKEEFERLEEKLEELKKEAAEDLADDGSVDSELEERIKELQETLVDVVPVEKGPPSGFKIVARGGAGRAHLRGGEPACCCTAETAATRDRDRVGSLIIYPRRVPGLARVVGTVTHAYVTRPPKSHRLVAERHEQTP